jgi:hypothetical protein
METKESLLDQMVEETAASTDQAAKKKEASASSNKKSNAPSDAKQQQMDTAIALGIDPAKIQINRDMSSMLARMQEGVVVTLHIKRPRFTAKLEDDDLGLTFSSAAREVMREYFKLGRRSILPADLQKELDTAEGNGRYILKKYGAKTAWGRFVSLKRFEQWKIRNEEMREAFFKLRDRLVEEYDEIVAQVVEAHRPMAEDAWRRRKFGEIINAADDLTDETMRDLLVHLTEAGTREEFVKAYLKSVELLMPEKHEIEGGFAWEPEISIVPLPSLVAKDMEGANRIYQERALEDARTQAELDRIRQEQRNTQRQLSLEQAVAEQEAMAKLQELRRKQQQQEQLEREVLEATRRQKDRLIQSFYTDVIGAINDELRHVSSKILDSLTAHDGKMPGPVASQLRNLVDRLKEMNFLEDERIDDQIERLRAILPSDEERTIARKGVARIDTSNIQRVLRTINEECNLVKIQLDTMGIERENRNDGESFAVAVPTIDDDQRQTRDDEFALTVKEQRRPVRRNDQRSI